MIRKLGLALSTAMVAGAIGTAAYAANPPLPGLVNLDFSATQNPPKGTFQQVNPTGWTGGSGLIYIDSTTIPGASAADSVPGTIQTYGNPTGAVTGNYVEADGNPMFESGFNYEVSGLTIGQTYTLSFYQGASQQVGFTGDTTNQWIVSLGKVGLSFGHGPCAPDSNDPTFGNVEHYCNTDPGASVVASPLMHVPSGGVVGWNFVSVDLTADDTTELLSFLAWGDNGSTANLPPMAFLAGVDSPPGLGSGAPEPAVWGLLLIGFAGAGGLLRAQRNARRSAAA
jgi:hypothetical protein